MEEGERREGEGDILGNLFLFCSSTHLLIYPFFLFFFSSLLGSIFFFFSFFCSTLFLFFWEVFRKLWRRGEVGGWEGRRRRREGGKNGLVLGGCLFLVTCWLFYYTSTPHLLICSSYLFLLCPFLFFSYAHLLPFWKAVCGRERRTREMNKRTREGLGQ